jgi:hypothetical protein
VITLGPEVGPKRQIWACEYTGKRWLPWDQRLVPWDKYGHVIEETCDYHGTSGWSQGTNMGLLEREQMINLGP